LYLADICRLSLVMQGFFQFPLHLELEFGFYILTNKVMHDSLTSRWVLSCPEEIEK